MNKKLIFLILILFILQLTLAQSLGFKETKLFTLKMKKKGLKGMFMKIGSWYLITEKED